MASEIETQLQEKLLSLYRSYDEELQTRRSLERSVITSALLFEAAGALYAIATCDLITVLPTKAMVSIPHPPKYVMGALTYRQEVYTVFEFSEMLPGTRDYRSKEIQDTRTDWVVLLTPAQEQFGIRVDALCGLRQLKDTQPVAARDGNSFLMATFIDNDRPGALVSGQKLLDTLS